MGEAMGLSIEVVSMSLVVQADGEPGEATEDRGDDATGGDIVDE